MNECKIVQDLLPLYAEDLVSEETKAFVDDHCESCIACSELKRRGLVELPETEKNPKEYQKALRKNQVNLICKVVTLLVVVVFLLYIGCTKLDAYIQWKEGKTPVEAVIETSTGYGNYGKITLVDWEESGRRIGNARNEGTLIRIEMQHFEQDEYGYGLFGSAGEMAEPWENVQAVWAPNGEEIFFMADLLDGGIGIFVRDYKYWMDENGSHSEERLFPERMGNGYLDILLDGCRNHPDFPSGWENIEFGFYQWKEDSETIIFVYETDNGRRGVLDFHYPSEIITDVN